MSKKPVNPAWFSELQTVGVESKLKWLTPFTNEVDRIANFGCWTGSEPFGLLWILDATKVVVVEKEETQLTKPKELKALLPKLAPGSLEGRSIEFIVADMTTGVLQPNYFDLAFCENVLYQIETNLGRQGVRRAIRQMTRCVKPGGLVVVVDNKIGAEFTEFEVEPFGKLPMQVTEATDISTLFEAEGLSRARSQEEYWIYCYRKSHTD